jgi:hypothetical protein
MCPHLITQDLLSSWNFFMLQSYTKICRAVQLCFISGNFKGHFTQRPTLVSVCSVDIPTVHMHSFQYTIGSYKSEESKIRLCVI